MIYLLSGFLGGVLRGLVGITKSKTLEKKKVNWWYLSFTLFVSALVGTVAGGYAQNSWNFAFLAGYAGTDFLEGLYKLRFKLLFKF